MTPDQAAETLKDRRAYRTTLIQKAEDTETKIKAVEAEISSLRAVAEPPEATAS